MSDTQIHYVLSNSNTSVCGRFREDQLNRDFVVQRYRNAPDLLAVVLGMTVLLSAYPAYSNSPVYETPQISLINMLDEDTVKVSDDHDYVKIQFEIVSKEFQEPIPFAKVIVKGVDGEIYAGAESDFDGIASFKLTPDQLEGASILAVQSFDYGNEVFVWDANWKGDNRYKIELENQVILLKGDVYIEPIKDKKTERQQRREDRKQPKKMGKFKF